MFTDFIMRHYPNGEMEYDRGGHWAKKGKVSRKVIDEYLFNHAYFKTSPSKTTGRELFGDEEPYEFIQIHEVVGLSKEDTVATTMKITAKAAVDAYNT